MRYDFVFICLINECFFLVCVCGGYFDVSYFFLGEIFYVGYCFVFVVEGFVLNVLWVRIFNYFLRSRFDL